MTKQIDMVATNPINHEKLFLDQLSILQRHVHSHEQKLDKPHKIV